MTSNGTTNIILTFTALNFAAFIVQNILVNLPIETTPEQLSNAIIILIYKKDILPRI